MLKRSIELGMKGVDIFQFIKQLRKYQAGMVNSQVSDGYPQVHKYPIKKFGLTPTFLP